MIGYVTAGCGLDKRGGDRRTKGRRYLCRGRSYGSSRRIGFRCSSYKPLLCAGRAVAVCCVCRYVEAETAWRGALLAAQRTHGSGSLEAAACHSGLGLTLSAAGRHREAGEQHGTALKLRRAALGELVEHRDVWYRRCAWRAGWRCVGRSKGRTSSSCEGRLWVPGAHGPGALGCGAGHSATGWGDGDRLLDRSTVTPALLNSTTSAKTYYRTAFWAPFVPTSRPRAPRGCRCPDVCCHALGRPPSRIASALAPLSNLYMLVIHYYAAGAPSGDTHLEVAASLSNVARVMRNTGRYREAEEAYGEALQVRDWGERYL